MSRETCRLGQRAGEADTHAVKTNETGTEPEVRSPLQGQVLSLTRDPGKGLPGEASRIRLPGESYRIKDRVREENSGGVSKVEEKQTHRHRGKRVGDGGGSANSLIY